jgi:hypothetical protein
MRTAWGLSLLCACASEPVRSSATPEPVLAAEAAPEPAPAPEPAFVNDPRWHDALRQISAGYTRWGRVDDEFRWAPWLCRMPRPALARISASGDDDTHGRKLYTLYARDPVAYGAQPSAEPVAELPGLSDISQVIVKEAWRPVETAASTAFGPGELRPASHDGKLWAPGERAGLYVMFRPVSAAAGDTDAGWVYGTVGPDLRTVTAAGKLATCMGCHQAEEDRLFGLPAE